MAMGIWGRRETDLTGPLDGIETGYEPKFDFPRAAHETKISYLLASVPRAGSSFLSHELWRTGCLGAPLEYLNFKPGGPFHFAASSTEAQQQLWARVVQTRTSPNGVFGLKAFLMQFHELQQSNPRLLASVLEQLLPKDRPRHIVYLRRRDKVAQAVSYARAAKSGVWRKEQESERSSWIDFSREDVEAAGRGIRVQEERWERMFSDLRIEPLRIWHEDTLSDPAATVRHVASYLGVDDRSASGARGSSRTETVRRKLRSLDPGLSARQRTPGSLRAGMNELPSVHGVGGAHGRAIRDDNEGPLKSGNRRSSGNSLRRPAAGGRPRFNRDWFTKEVKAGHSDNWSISVSRGP